MGAVDGDVEGVAFVDEVGDFVGVAEFAGEEGGHKFDGVVGFEVGGSVSEDGVGGGVGFVEAVAGEFFEEVEDFAGFVGGEVVGGFGAAYEVLALEAHFFVFLFAHGAPQDVGGAGRIACDAFGGFDDLFLVDHDAVGFSADIFEEGMGVADGAGVVFASNVVGDEVHGAGPVEGDEGDDFVDVGNFELAAEGAHAAGFELEDADGSGCVEELEGFGVVEGDGFDVEVGEVAGAADVFLGVGDDGEGFEAEEVHLEEAKVFDGVFGVLGGEVAFLEGDGDELSDRLVGDEDAAGVFACVADHAFDDFAVVEDLAGLGVAVVLGFEFGAAFEGVVEGDFGVVGDHFGKAVGFGVGEFEDAGEVSYDHFCAEGAEGDDVGDGVAAVFFADVVEDFVAAAFAEIDVEVGWGDAFGVEEAFEEEFEAEGVDVGDFEEVGDEAAGAGAASGADGDGAASGPVDEVPDDEEVVEEAGVGDGGEFVVEAFDEGAGGGVGGVGLGVVDVVAFFEALDAEVLEVGCVVGMDGAEGVGEFIYRVVVLAEWDVEVAHFSYDEGVG